jgi:hypothetical protein
LGLLGLPSSGIGGLRCGLLGNSRLPELLIDLGPDLCGDVGGGLVGGRR